MKITLRIYGILLHKNQLLISREQYKGVEMFKFPGGGMEEGEGTLDTLVREWQEELGVTVEPIEHLYTTDFYTQSTFDPDYQVVSIYYRVNLSQDQLDSLPVEEKGTLPEQKKESFQWYPLEELHSSMFTFETERAAFRELQKFLMANG